MKVRISSSISTLRQNANFPGRLLHLLLLEIWVSLCAERKWYSNAKVNNVDDKLLSSLMSQLTDRMNVTPRGATPWISQEYSCLQYPPCPHTPLEAQGLPGKVYNRFHGNGDGGGDGWLFCRVPRWWNVGGNQGQKAGLHARNGTECCTDQICCRSKPKCRYHSKNLFWQRGIS